jgi:hypothetical protein
MYLEEHQSKQYQVVSTQNVLIARNTQVRKCKQSINFVSVLKILSQLSKVVHHVGCLLRHALHLICL